MIMSDQNNQQYKYREKHKYRTYSPFQDEVKTSGTCTFCGAELEGDERFCPDCGNPRDGIRCPLCGTLSHRSFCIRCNTPLNELAKEAVAKAKADPMFRRAEKLAAELAELEKQILQASQAPAASLDTSVRSEARRDAERYASLFSDVASLKVPDVPQATAKPRSNVATGDLLAKAQEAYRQKEAELQAALDAMLPPASATPEEKRNFFCARLIQTVDLQAVKQVWVCNYCGCYHNAPSECVQPELGGKWIMFQAAKQKTSVMYD